MVRAYVLLVVGEKIDRSGSVWFGVVGWLLCLVVGLVGSDGMVNLVGSVDNFAQLPTEVSIRLLCILKCGMVWGLS